MSETEAIRRALRHNVRPSRRQRRAARAKVQTLTPRRVVKSLLMLPFLTLSIALSVYIRTSPLDPPDALIHLAARVNCDAARAVGLAPAYRGGVGYHARNDADGDGVACENTGTSVQSQQNITRHAVVQPQGAPVRMVGGARFIRP